jgi:hypothetical protein
MNTKEIDLFVRGDCASRGSFQGVFSVETLPDKPRLLICNTIPRANWTATGLLFSSILKGLDNISVCSGANRQHYLKTIETKTAPAGFSVRDHYRTSSAVTAAFTAVYVACLDIEVLT